MINKVTLDIGIKDQTKEVTIEYSVPSAQDALEIQRATTELSYKEENDPLKEYQLALGVLISHLKTVDGEELPDNEARKTAYLEERLGIYAINYISTEIYSSRMLGKFPAKG